MKPDPNIELARKQFNWSPAIMLGDGTWVPPRPPQATSEWVITPQGWLPPPTFNEMAAMMPVPLWRRLLGRFLCWWKALTQ